MGSGQKAWEDEQEQIAWEERVKRLESIGVYKAASKIDTAYECLYRLESSLTMSKGDWSRFEYVMEALKELK
jgi:ribosomal protein S2